MKKNIILDRWKCERCDRGPCFYISASRPLICPFMVDHPILVGWSLQEEKMKEEETKKLSVDELEHKINVLAGLFGISDDRLRVYLAGLLDGCKIHHNRTRIDQNFYKNFSEYLENLQLKADEKLRVKLKGIDFFKSGIRGVTIRGGDALVLLGELKDGRSTTQVIPWDAIIEVTTEPACPVVTQVKK